MSDVEEFEFHCPDCAQTIEVNASMRDALIDNGCVICGVEVSHSAFSPSGNGRGRRPSP